MPSYIDLVTPIAGISIEPSATSATGARGSAGGASGFGNVSATVVGAGATVVDVVVEVLVVVDDVDDVDVDVVVGVVVDVVVVDATIVITAVALGLSSPQEATSIRAAQPTAIALRRITQSASEIHDCNTVAAAC